MIASRQRIVEESLVALSLMLLAVAPSWAAKSDMPLEKPPRERYTVLNLAKYVNPFCGTIDGGNEYPGATLPFGMIQWSPDTGPNGAPGGYNYTDSLIYGFSVDHLSGAGAYYAGDFDFTPLLEARKIVPPVGRTAFPLGFSHANETAVPGFYSVSLNNGVRIELTATTRTGFARFIFPNRGTPTIVINAGSNVNGTSHASVTIDPADSSVSGSATGGHFLGHSDVRTVYFYAVFSSRFSTYGVWADSVLKKMASDGEGKTAGAYVTLKRPNGGIVLVKVAISYVNTENARENLEAERPASDFSSKAFYKTAKAAGRIWNLWLNKIQITGGTIAERKTFYSMFYHALLAPTICSDANGEYMGYDGKIHTIERGHALYADFSGWDVYRSECQFLGMIAPKEASDMAQSLLIDYRQGGAFPRWGIPGMDSGVMLGDPAASMIADFYAFGARDFDAKAAVAGLLRAATDTSVYAPRSGTYERDGLAGYLKYSYVPEYTGGGPDNVYHRFAIYTCVSVTLEYAAADFAVAQLEKALGNEADYALMMKHSQSWQKLYDPETGYIQMRRRDGSWAPGFKPNVHVYDDVQAYDEGTAGQYVWMVPFDLHGLAEKMGGDKIAVARLDSFFTKLNAGPDSRYAYLGNEPCLETPWIYCFLGQPYKTQEVVRRAITELYSFKPDGYPGNDDLGEMSSWYIWSALGMYPELPGSDVLVLGSPLFKKAVLHLKRSEAVIEAKGAAHKAPYVESLTVNGKVWKKPWLRFRDIENGDTLVYTLGTAPDKKWGSAPNEAPPSYH